jgi:CheY-like chemotaxis protein
VKKKILLVDGTRATLEREKGFLDREIFQVQTARNGEEAIELHRREKFDVIVMDLDMPKPAGDEVCGIIKADPELGKVSILLATVKEDGEEVERCKKAGADGHIKKPIDKQALGESLAALLGVSARQAIRILVQVRVEGRLGNNFFIANTVDVSVSGLLFECERELKVGEAAEMSFFISGAGGFKRVVASSEVKRVAKVGDETWRCGARFTEFKEGSARLIGEFIEKKTGRPCTV